MPTFPSHCPVHLSCMDRLLPLNTSWNQPRWNNDRRKGRRKRRARRFTPPSPLLSIWVTYIKRKNSFQIKLKTALVQMISSLYLFKPKVVTCPFSASSTSSMQLGKSFSIELFLNDPVFVPFCLLTETDHILCVSVLRCLKHYHVFWNSYENIYFPHKSKFFDKNISMHFYVF